MPEVNDLLAEIESLGADAPLTTPEKVLGYSRSYLAGPTFNFADNIEALMASVFTDKTYGEELSGIREEQDRFKAKTDYLDNLTELVSGTLLNPVSKLRALKTATSAVPLLPTTTNLVTSPPAQAALASVGAADGEDLAKNALIGAAIGSGGSAISSVFGSALEKTARNADRFKLSAYGVGSADISKQLRKLGDEAAYLGDAGQIPLVKTLAKAEAEGLINAGDDLLTNAGRVAKKQDLLGNKLSGILDYADDAIAPNKNFSIKHTTDYIEGLSGTAKEQAEKTAMEELEAISSQLGAGRLPDFQRVKVGLNYKFDDNPYKDDVIKALRSDLRSTIESRVDSAALAGRIDPKLAGTVKQLNSEWGELAELKNSFVRRGARDLQGDMAEDVFRGGATTSGAGSMNIASATTGNPVYAAIGALANAARVPESKSMLGDVLRDPGVNVPAQLLGKALPEIGTARNFAQAREALTPEASKPKAQNTPDLKSLLDEIEKLGGVSTKESKTPAITSMFSKDDAMKPISDIEAEIDSDPYLSALYEAESGRNPKAKNPNSSASGGFQFINSTAKTMGLKDPFDLEESLGAVKKLTTEHRSKFGDDPELLYAAHYLGSTVLNKWLDKKPLSQKETMQIQDFKTQAWPRFKRIYDKIRAKDVLEA